MNPDLHPDLHQHQVLSSEQSWTALVWLWDSLLLAGWLVAAPGLLPAVLIRVLDWLGVHLLQLLPGGLATPPEPTQGLTDTPESQLLLNSALAPLGDTEVSVTQNPGQQQVRPVHPVLINTLSTSK